MVESEDAGFRLLSIPGRPGIQLALPPFDPGSYRFHMHLDRVQLLLEIERGRGGGPTTDFHAVRASCERSIGKSLSVAAVNGRTFRINVQDPEVKVLVVLQDSLKADFGSNTRVVLREVEVALDLFPRETTDAEARRAAAVVFLRRFFAPEAVRRELDHERHWPRIVLGPKKVFPLWTRPDGAPGFALDRHLDGTFYVGEERSNGVYFKIYDKQRNGVGGPSECVLPDEMRPVRVEATIAGSEIFEVFEGNDVHALITNRCRRVGRLFSFFVPVVPLETEEASAFAKMICQKKRQVVLDVLTRDYGVYGAMLGRRVAGSDKRVKCGLRAHAEMRECIQSAFRAFQKRMVARPSPPRAGRAGP